MPTASRILLILSLTACACSVTTTPIQTPTPGALVGTQWKLISLKGRKPIDGTTITLVFTEGFLRGSAGCNTYGNGPDSGPYRATVDGTLAITQTAITVMACGEPPGIMEQEAAYMGALREAATYRVVNGELEIFNSAGEMVLVYERDG